MVTRIGTQDPDTLIGSTDADSLDGRGGDDLLQPLSGLDTAYGGTGNDVIAFVDLSGGQAFGGSGLDTLDITLAAGPSLFLDFRDGQANQSGTVPGPLTFSGMDRLVLSSQGDGDTVIGSNGGDVILFGGRGGQINARGGDDLVAVGRALNDEAVTGMAAGGELRRDQFVQLLQRHGEVAGLALVLHLGGVDGPDHLLHHGFVGVDAGGGQIRNGYGEADQNDGDHDHEFHESEASLVVFEPVPFSLR